MRLDSARDSGWRPITASVYQRKGRTFWLVDYTDGTGQRVTGKRLPAHVTTQRQAEAAARAIEHAVGVERAPLPGLAVAQDALDDWLADREARRSPATAAYYQKHARAWAALPLSGPLSALTPSPSSPPRAAAPTPAATARRPRCRPSPRTRAAPERR